MHTIVMSDNLPVLRSLPDGSVRLAYTDPPFNTGRRQHRRRMTASRDDGSARRGFGGRCYRTTAVGSPSFGDAYDDYLAFLEPRLVELRRVLTRDGSLLLHLDWREVHYVKVCLDRLFGRGSFMNEIVWAYDYGARTRRRWPAKHDTILWYTKDPRHYVFDYAAVDRVPYLAPALAGPEKAARGKTPTDVWWQTIVSPTGREKTGYPTQKPLAIAERIVRVHTRPGDLVLDCFAGSGTVGEAAARLGRRFLLIDDNEDAIAVMRTRLARWKPRVVRRLGPNALRLTPNAERRAPGPHRSTPTSPSATASTCRGATPGASSRRR